MGGGRGSAPPAHLQCSPGSRVPQAARAWRAVAAVAPLAAALALALAAGCGGGAPAARRAPPRTPAPGALAVRVLADSGRSTTLPVVAPPPVAVSLARVTPAAASPPVAPLPDAAPDSPAAAPPVTPTAAAGTAGERLLAPILRRPGTLVVPPGARGGVVELDVLVDESGRVADVRVAAGAADTARVAAARRCAAAMEFYPARLGDRAVAVWCRQRFEFGAH